MAPSACLGRWGMNGARVLCRRVAQESPLTVLATDWPSVVTAVSASAAVSYFGDPRSASKSIAKRAPRPSTAKDLSRTQS